jgi:hypothetical protein
MNEKLCLGASAVSSSLRHCLVDGVQFDSVRDQHQRHIPWRHEPVLNAENGDGKGLLDDKGRRWMVIRGM